MRRTKVLVRTDKGQGRQGIRLVALVGAVLLATTLGCRMADDHGRAARAHMVISSEVTCPTCTIVVESGLTLEGAYVGRLPSENLARHPQGLFYLVVDAGDRLLKLYGANGQLVRQVGRRGAGPGEYELIRNVMFADDGSILVLDAALARLSTFSPAGDFVRSVQVPVFGGYGQPAVLMPNGQLVVSAAAPLLRPAATGYALTIIDREGNVAGMLDEVAGADPRRWWLYERVLERGPDGDLLVGHPYTFTVDVYSWHPSKPPTKQLSIRRVGDWIPSEPPESDPSDGLFDEPPTPVLVLVWQDKEGFLWLAMFIPSASWIPAPPPRRGMLNEEIVSRLSRRPRVEQIIEVIDLQRGAVVTRLRRTRGIGYHLGGGYFAEPVEGSLGEPSLQTLRVKLRR